MINVDAYTTNVCPLYLLYQTQDTVNKTFRSRSNVVYARVVPMYRAFDGLICMGTSKLK